MVTWVTWISTNGSSALYWPSPPDYDYRSHSAPSPFPTDRSHHQLSRPQQMAYGSEVRAVDGGPAARVYYIHRVTLGSLVSDTDYSTLLLSRVCSLHAFFLNYSRRLIGKQ